MMESEFLFCVMCERSRFRQWFRRLPPDLRKHLRAVIEDLQQRIPPSNRHLEKVKSNSVWSSVRLDQGSGYRVILYSDKGCWVIGWVDKHDDAYDWAQRNQPLYRDYCDCATECGIIWELPTPPAEAPVPELEALDPLSYPFVMHAPEILVKLGVPTVEWARYLQGLKSEDIETELLRMSEEGIISQFALVRLQLLAWGEEPSKLLPPAQLNRAADEALLSSDFRGVRWRPEDWEQLDDHLQRFWGQWLVFLNPSQEEMARHEFSGPARVTGGPGTGKTIVALHRAKALAERYYPGKILLTTYTKSLAAELKRRAELLFPNASNIEIVHLDGFVQEGIKHYYPSVKIEYDEKKLKSYSRFDQIVAELRLKLTPKFVWDEWQQVVDAWDIRSETEYLEFNREGRERALNPDERRALWKVFEQMRTNFEQTRTNFRSERVMTANQACNELSRRYRNHPPFRCVLADEAQDFGPAQMRLLQALAPADEPDNLFFCVDVSQRIYARSVPWVRYQIDVRGRSKRLRINYRNTLEIQKEAEKVLSEEDQIKQAEALDDPEVLKESLRTGWRPIPVIRNPEYPPQYQSCKSRVDEAEQLQEWIKQCHAADIRYNEIAVVARTRNALDEIIVHALRELGLTACELEHEASVDQIYADTAHAIKGLEFRAVAIIAAELFFDKHALDRDALQRERNLLFTAMTRARERLYISWTGETPSLLRHIIDSNS